MSAEAAPVTTFDEGINSLVKELVSSIPAREQKEFLPILRLLLKVVKKEGNRRAYLTRQSWKKKSKQIRLELDELRKKNQDLQKQVDHWKELVQKSEDALKQVRDSSMGSRSSNSEPVATRNMNLLEIEPTKKLEEKDRKGAKETPKSEAKSKDETSNSRNPEQSSNQEQSRLISPNIQSIPHSPVSDSVAPSVGTYSQVTPQNENIETHATVSNLASGEKDSECADNDRNKRKRTARRRRGANANRRSVRGSGDSRRGDSRNTRSNEETREESVRRVIPGVDTELKTTDEMVRELDILSHKGACKKAGVDESVVSITVQNDLTRAVTKRILDVGNSLGVVRQQWEGARSVTLFYSSLDRRKLERVNRNDMVIQVWKEGKIEDGGKG